MFEIACEIANTSGKTLTIETSIPEAEKPDVQILKSGHQNFVFASPTRSTVKITVVSVEASDHIEKLEAANLKQSLIMVGHLSRIEELEAALRDMMSKCTWEKRKQWCGSMGCHCQIARKALENPNE